MWLIPLDAVVPTSPPASPTGRAAPRGLDPSDLVVWIGGATMVVLVVAIVVLVTLLIRRSRSDRGA